MAYTAADLCTEVRRGGSLPDALATGTLDADILAHADSELRDTLGPALLSVREEFYQRVFDATATAGVAPYRINKRAAISRVNTVQWINTDTSIRNLARYEPKEVAELGLLVGSTGQSTSYYLEGSRVVLYPTPNTTGTLRIRAMVRPSRLTLPTDTTNVRAVTAVTTSASTYTLTSVAHGISGSGVRDVVASTPSFEHLALDATATVVDVDNVTMPLTAFSSPPIVGDYLCVSDFTPVIQLPVELHPALVELTVARILRAQGDSSEADSHASEAQRLVAIAVSALSPRVDSANRKLLGGPMWRRRGLGFRGVW